MMKTTHVMHSAVAVALTSIVVPAVAAGCGGPADELEGVTAVSADLTDWSEVEFGVIGGFVSASAVLTFTDAQGGGHSVPVGVGGPIVGLVFDFHAIEEDGLFDGSGGASMSVPDGGVPVPDLFHAYTGSGAAGGIALGGGTHDLENDAGVGISAGGLGFAVGMLADFEWFNIDPQAEVR